MCLKHFVLNFFKHLYFCIPLIKSLSRPSKVRFRNTGIFSPLFVFGNNHWIKTPLPKLQQLWLLLYEVNSFYNRNWKHLCFRVWLKKKAGTTTVLFLATVSWTMFLTVFYYSGITNYPIGVGINGAGEITIADNHNNFNLSVFSQDGQLISALESKVRYPTVSGGGGGSTL